MSKWLPSKRHPYRGPKILKYQSPMPLPLMSVPPSTPMKQVASTRRRKTAVLISGFLRTFWANCRNVMENLIEPNQADIFIYTGFDRAKVRPPDSRCSSDVSRDGVLLEFDEKTFFEKELGDFLKVFRTIEDERDSYVEEYRSVLGLCPYCRCGLTDHPECREADEAAIRGTKWHTLDSHLRLRRCNALRKQYEQDRGFEYDTVVRLRGDTRLSFPLDLSRYSSTDKVLYSEGSHPVGPEGVQRECFFFAGGLVIDTVCEFFYEFGRYTVKTGHWDDLRQFRLFLDRHGIRRRLFNSALCHFFEDPEYQRSRCSRTGRPCTCCLAWEDVPVDPYPEIPGTVDVRQTRVLVL